MADPTNLIERFDRIERLERIYGYIVLAEVVIGVIGAFFLFMPLESFALLSRPYADTQGGWVLLSFSANQDPWVWVLIGLFSASLFLAVEALRRLVKRRMR